MARAGRQALAPALPPRMQGGGAARARSQVKVATFYLPAGQQTVLLMLLQSWTLLWKLLDINLHGHTDRVENDYHQSADARNSPTNWDVHVVPELCLLQD